MRFAPRFSVTESIAAALARIEEGRAFLGARKLSEDWLATRRSRAFLLEAHHTAKLDGQRMTLEQSESSLAGGEVPCGEPDDARALRNYGKAIEFVSGYIHDGRPVTATLIADIHKRLVDGVGGDTAAPGQYRSVDGYVVRSATKQVMYAPPAAADVPVRVDELVAWLNAEPEVHPVLVAGVVQFQLVHIHPFHPGSGRTAHLFSTLCLHRAGYDFKGVLAISEHYGRNRTAFHRAMQGARDAGMDLTGWLEFFTEGLASQLDAVRSEIEQEIQRDVAARHGLTERQAAAVGHVRDEGRLVIADFERLCPGVPRRALQRELKQLVDKGLLRRAGPANRPHYLAGEEVEGPGTVKLPPASATEYIRTRFPAAAGGGP